ncbi:hypothetical protein E2562_005853 [Oryza meyeriana var. granulata]|uniref:Uncharacterized protein n=1 Tax=Oryza meyeriana var. granulata TaxID=110450 RepID=A0A6G1CDP8_9ORYZ|nr:hypothetical protein E2562_005853 [Oryza meyeriana var. granulata]
MERCGKKGALGAGFIGGGGDGVATSPAFQGRRGGPGSIQLTASSKAEWRGDGIRRARGGDFGANGVVASTRLEFGYNRWAIYHRAK